jgi:hypothetical protein
MSVLGTVPVVGLFIVIGLLLYVFYDRPDLMGGATALAANRFGGEKISIFMHYILTQLPGGLRGLVTVGICAAAVATTNSALNAMSSVLVQDFYRPWRESAARGRRCARTPLRSGGRAGMGLIGLAMFLMAVVSFIGSVTRDGPAGVRASGHGLHLCRAAGRLFHGAVYPARLDRLGDRGAAGRLCHGSAACSPHRPRWGCRLAGQPVLSLPALHRHSSLPS